MSDFGVYTGEEFFSLKIPKRKFLIDRIIKEQDSVLLVGNEKSGKSLLIFQLICSGTSAHPFLDRFNVTSPIRISYVQIEGELEDSQDRFKRMFKVIDMDPRMFQLLFLPPINLQDRGDTNRLIADLAKHQPQLVILDPLYFSMAGSLSDDLCARQFIGNLRVLKDTLKCALVLVHHTHRMRFDKEGQPVTEGDEAFFGSKFFKAWADHTILFTHDKTTNIRTFSCSTQRSGEIQEALTVKLNQPDPLYFSELTCLSTHEDKIIDLLKHHPQKRLTVDEITHILNIKRDTFYNSVKGPLSKGIISKSNGRPVQYFLTVEKVNELDQAIKKIDGHPEKDVR